MENLVTTDWLSDNLDRVKIVDASWYMPAENRDCQAEYLARHIPGAVYFDIDEIADTSVDLPHMLPSEEKFVSRVRAMGIGDSDPVVVYDTAGVFSAPRVWWTFKAFGKDDVAVLDGGLPKWVAEGRDIETGEVIPNRSHFHAKLNPARVIDLDGVNAARGTVQIVDARSAVRFRGEVAEPRPELRRGRIPGSLNVFFADLSENGQMKSPDAIRAIFTAAGVDLSQPAITTCGSGVTAAMLSFAMALAGADHSAVYDGSWTEWGGRQDTEIATG